MLTNCEGPFLSDLLGNKDPIDLYNQLLNDTTYKYTVTPPVDTLQTADFRNIKIGNTWKYYYYHRSWSLGFDSKDAKYVTVNLSDSINNGYILIIDNSPNNSYYFKIQNDTLLISSACIYTPYYYVSSITSRIIKLDDSSAVCRIVINSSTENDQYLLHTKYGILYKYHFVPAVTMDGANDAYYILLTEFNGKSINTGQILREFTEKENYLNHL